jgi:hypothetical protein
MYDEVCSAKSSLMRCLGPAVSVNLRVNWRYVRHTRLGLEAGWTNDGRFNSGPAEEATSSSPDVSESAILRRSKLETSGLFETGPRGTEARQIPYDMPTCQAAARKAF